MMIFIILTLAFISMFILLFMPTPGSKNSITDLDETKPWELKKGTPQWDIYKGTKLYELELWWDKEHLEYTAFYDKYGFYSTPPRKVEKDYPRLLRGVMDPNRVVSFIPKDSADFSRVMIHGSSALILEIDNEVEQTRRELREYQIEMKELERERKTMLDGLKKKDLMWDS